MLSCWLYKKFSLPYKFTFIFIFLKGHFGGSFKEHISVACLSRCFKLAQQIMEAYSRWELKQQTNNKINRMLFAQLPGVKSEDVIFEHLMKLKTKKISKAEFNEELKIFKVKKKSSLLDVKTFRLIMVNNINILHTGV